jgi:hypothetical protein
MMLVPSLMSLAIASVAVCWSVNTKEEIIKVSMAGIAILCLFLSLWFAPWIIKALLLAAPLAIDKFQFQ